MKQVDSLYAEQYLLWLALQHEVSVWGYRVPLNAYSSVMTQHESICTLYSIQMSQ